MTSVATPTPTKTPHIDPADKPIMRGWLHLAFAPVVFVYGLVLTVLAPSVLDRAGTAIWTATAVQLFGTSAAYHRGNWTTPTHAIFRRIDHSNIFIFIAGTYTPLTLSLLEGDSRTTLLVLIWSLAVVGVLFRVFWIAAPRWLYTALYVAMGWVALWWLPEFWNAGGPAVVILILGGGIIYSLGAVAYGLKKPEFSSRWFGFHEIFHTCTILGAVCQGIAIGLSVL